MDEDDDVVARVEELSELHRPALPLVCPACGVVQYRLMAVRDFPVREVRPIPLDIGVEPLERATRRGGPIAYQRR